MTMTLNVDRTLTCLKLRCVITAIQRRFVAMATDSVKAGDPGTSITLRLTSMRLETVLELQLSARHSTPSQHTQSHRALDIQDAP